MDSYRYSSSTGMKTKEWGPAGWKFLFTSIMGGYPYKYDKNNKVHRTIKKGFVSMFESLKYTLPCQFCRESYAQYYEELPIDRFLGSRLDLMFWLYSIKDKVNIKLIQQEQELYENKKLELKSSVKMGEMTKSEYKKRIHELKSSILKTVPSPSFVSVLEQYESYRASCNKSLKTCN